jgi:hypothetical protein
MRLTMIAPTKASQSYTARVGGTVDLLDGFRIWYPSRAHRTPVAAQSNAPEVRRAARLTAFQNLLRHSAMPRKITQYTSRATEPDEKPPKYDLRKRAAHQIKSVGKSLEDERRQNLARRTKRTPTNTRAQPSPPRGSVKKRTRVSSSGQGWDKRNKNREWLAEAILKENNTQYLIAYEPVSEGAQREISWQPKHYANAALARDWEERKMASAHQSSNAERDDDPALTKKENEARRRRSLMAYGGQTRKLSINLRLPEQYNTESEEFQQDSTDHVDKRTSAGFEETSRKTSLIAASPIIPRILDNLVPERNVPVARMYGSVASNDRRVASARPGAQPDSYDQAEGLEQFPQGHVAKQDGHGRPSPRPGTSISTILSQASFTLSNINRDKESATFGGRDNEQALPRTLAHVEVSKNRNCGVSGGVSGELASAREKLRLLLRGPGRRRFQKSSLRFPPSP